VGEVAKRARAGVPGRRTGIEGWVNPPSPTAECGPRGEDSDMEDDDHDEVRL
jgi:hypothetical protein